MFFEYRADRVGWDSGDSRDAGFTDQLVGDSLRTVCWRTVWDVYRNILENKTRTKIKLNVQVLRQNISVLSKSFSCRWEQRSGVVESLRSFCKQTQLQRKDELSDCRCVKYKKHYVTIIARAQNLWRTHSIRWLRVRVIFQHKTVGSAHSIKNSVKWIRFSER